jgi:hypothetical protein
VAAASGLFPVEARGPAREPNEESSMSKAGRSIAACALLACAACSGGSIMRSSHDDAGKAPPGEADDSPVEEREDGAIDEPKGDAGGTPRSDAGRDGAVARSCQPSAASESVCGDAIDQDCDGFIDCLDPDCAGASCGAGALTCNAGGCLAPCTKADACLPELPALENVVATVRGDTLLVDFAAVAGARDYRIYPYPKEGSVLSGSDGALVVRDAIYRCSGDRPRPRRDRDGINLVGISLEGNIHGFMRKQADALLGHVFLTPAAGREPVYRLGDPNRNGSYTWPYAAPPGMDYTAGDYVLGKASRDALLAKGLRDDGIAFYVPTDAARKVYRFEDDSTVLFYVDGAEASARKGGSEHLRIMAEARPGSVPLYRIFYASGGDHDVLAAGEVNRERVLNQGNVPLTTVVWPNMTGKTMYVIEALDTGCPFPGGLIGAKASPADPSSIATAPTITLDNARLAASGELFVNGQFDAANRPRPIARAYVTASPEPQPDMDWFMSFDEPLAPFSVKYEDGNGIRIHHNDKLSMEFAAANHDFSYGTVLGQFVAGSSASFSISARGADAHIEDTSYLHVTMSTDIPSTFRRYPQIFITDTPIDPATFEGGPQRVITARLGPYTFEKLPPGPNHSILVQVFGPSPELQVQFCDQRGWGVSDQCPRANIYGFHAGVDNLDWTAPWLPLPVLGEYVGVDRPVKFDVYASTERVYVYVEDKPAGCAVLPAGRMPKGKVNVVFGSAGYHIDVDEFIERKPPMHEYWSRQSLNHVERRFDDLGVDSATSLPGGWDESVMPCGTRFYD